MRRYCSKDKWKSPLHLQQDGTPAQDSKRMQDWLKVNLPEVWVEEVWLPSSADFNPFVYFSWGVFE
jgi:hypothetical protein